MTREPESPGGAGSYKFHQAWVISLSQALNQGLLPSDHHAVPEQVHGDRVLGDVEQNDEGITFVVSIEAIRATRK